MTGGTSISHDHTIKLLLERHDGCQDSPSLAVGTVASHTSSTTLRVSDDATLSKSTFQRVAARITPTLQCRGALLQRNLVLVQSLEVPEVVQALDLGIVALALHSIPASILPVQEQEGLHCTPIDVGVPAVSIALALDIPDGGGLITRMQVLHLRHGLQLLMREVPATIATIVSTLRHVTVLLGLQSYSQLVRVGKTQ